MNRTPQRWRRLRWLVGAALTSSVAMTTAAPAHAWDPSTTHVGMVSRALTESAMHVRWMESSELSRGLFTPIRIDPRRLDDDLRRRIEIAQRHAHADSGARTLGGPGACPGATAPASTRARCVEGDLWEATALGWVTLGLIAEITPRERILHHFTDPADLGAATWKGERLPTPALRATQRRAGGARLTGVTGTAFRGTAPSATAWLDDPTDPWAPPAMFEHLRKASLLEDSAARRHHLALALIGLGALLHVLQDVSVPAHARADLAAFLAPLSNIPGDRGLPLAEYAKLQHGRAGLPRPVSLDVRDPASRRGTLRANTLRDHLVGRGVDDGVAVIASERFLSEGTLPAPMSISPDLSAEEAAAALLADSNLSPLESDGARMSAWPASDGYVLSAAGRPLAAFSTDSRDRIRLQLDRRVYRDQIGHLIPMAIDASRSAVDLVFPAWPSTDHSPGSDILDIDATALVGTDPELSILIESSAGARRLVRTVKLKPSERNQLVGAVPELAEGERVVLVVQSSIGPHRVTTESFLTRPTATEPAAPALPDEPDTPEPDTTEPGTTESDTTEPGTTGSDTTEPDTTEPGTTEPGATEPGTTEPGTTEPGTTEPGTTEPDTTEPDTTDGDAVPPKSDPDTDGPDAPATGTPPAGAPAPGQPPGNSGDSDVLKGARPGAVPTPSRPE